MAESIPALENRAYRKSLTGTGLIYLGAVEHEIHLLNISLTGLLAELKFDAFVHDVKDMFQVLRVSPVVDIYLPDLRMAGEVEVVRAEPAEEGIQIGMEFRHLSYDINNLLYNRRAYRKDMAALGRIVINGSEFMFSTENVSVGGLMIRILGRLDAEIGTIIRFDYQQLELQGEAEVIWIDRDYHSTLMGLKYLHLERAGMLCVSPSPGS